MTLSNEEHSYRNLVISRLQSLTPYLQKYALGDFSLQIPIPEEEDEFTELLVGLTLMVEDFQQLLQDQQETITRLRETEEELALEREIIRSMLSGIEDVIYVSDPDTYELLYVNQSGKELWGANAEGTVCYQTLHNRDDPCPFCTNHLIFGEYRGQAYIWEFQNEVTGDWYRCADKAIPWKGGKMVRFEMAVKITEEKRVQLELETNLAELERFNKLAVDRELRMVELKREVNLLSAALGREEPYSLTFVDQE